MLKFEKWVNEQKINDYEKKFFEDSIICYKVNAYRPAFIMAYVGILVVAKNRILDKENIKPTNIKESLWNDAIKKLKNETKWEEAIFNYLQNPKQDSIFKLKIEIIQDLKCFKTTRNKAVHARGAETSHIKVEYIWEFIENNLNNIHIGGGKEYITELLVDSFDRRRSNEKENYQDEINQVKDIFNKEELLEFLLNLKEKYKKLDKYKIEKNIFEFYNSLIIRDLELRKVLIKYLMHINDDHNICAEFIYFYNNFYTIYKELIQDETYVKKLWHSYVKITPYNFMDDTFEILKILDKENLLHAEDYTLFYDRMLIECNIYSIKILEDDEVISILLKNNLQNELLAKLKAINYEIFSTAFENENLIHSVIKYCDIDDFTYEITLYFIKRCRMGSLYNGIIQEIEKENYKDNCIEYEKKSSKNGISLFMGWT